VTFNQAGSCVIDANQAGDAKYQAAPQAQQVITVDGIAQSISFTYRGSAPIPDQGLRQDRSLAAQVPGSTSPWRQRAKGGYEH
jgi:hypothetical protein